MRRELADGLGGAVLAGPTYAAHPVSCAAAAKVIEIYTRDRVFEHAAELGRYTAAALHERIVAEIPIVDHCAGYGMLLGLELLKNAEAKEGYSHEALEALQDVALGKGLYIRIAGAGSRIMFCPPLVSTHEEVDSMIAILAEALRDTAWMGL